MFYMLQVYALVIVVVVGPALLLYLLAVIGGYASSVFQRLSNAVAHRSARQTESSCQIRRRLAPYSQNAARAHARMTRRPAAIRVFRGQVGKRAIWRRQFSVLSTSTHESIDIRKPL